MLKLLNTFPYNLKLRINEVIVYVDQRTAKLHSEYVAVLVPTRMPPKHVKLLSAHLRLCYRVTVTGPALASSRVVNLH